MGAVRPGARANEWLLAWNGGEITSVGTYGTGCGVPMPIIRGSSTRSAKSANQQGYVFPLLSDIVLSSTPEHSSSSSNEDVMATELEWELPNAGACPHPPAWGTVASGDILEGCLSSSAGQVRRVVHYSAQAHMHKHGLTLCLYGAQIASYVFLV